MDEKKKIEHETARGFLKLYNARFGTDFEIVELQDAPDVKCRDSKGNQLNLEITLTQDRPRDIQALLGRSSHRGVEALRARNKTVAEGKEEAQFSSLSDNVLDQVVKRINEKLSKRYGPNTALVVRDTSGVDWDWDDAIGEVANKLDLKRTQFDKGIWIVNVSKTKLYRVIEGQV